MHDTAFRIGDAQRQRLVEVAVRTGDGGLSSIAMEVEQEPEFYMGGGLYGTAPDYLRFCRMILNGGTLDGARVLTLLDQYKQAVYADSALARVA